TLEYAGVVAISLVVSFWLYIFVVDLVFSLVWLALTRTNPPDPAREPVRYRVHQLVELVNRQLLHIEAFLTWMVGLRPSTPRISFQTPALLELAIIGPGLSDWLTLPRYPGLSRVNGELQFARRSMIYVAMILGLVILIGRSTDQRLHLLRLAVA